MLIFGPFLDASDQSRGRTYRFSSTYRQSRHTIRMSVSIIETRLVVVWGEKVRVNINP